MPPNTQPHPFNPDDAIPYLLLSSERGDAASLTLSLNAASLASLYTNAIHRASHNPANNLCTKKIIRCLLQETLAGDMAQLLEPNKLGYPSIAKTHSNILLAAITSACQNTDWPIDPPDLINDFLHYPPLLSNTLEQCPSLTEKLHNHPANQQHHKTKELFICQARHAELYFAIQELITPQQQNAVDALLHEPPARLDLQKNISDAILELANSDTLAGHATLQWLDTLHKLQFGSGSSFAKHILDTAHAIIETRQLQLAATLPNPSPKKPIL